MLTSSLHGIFIRELKITAMITVERALEIAKEYNCSQDRGELVWLAEMASKHSLIAEIGCWVGRTTRAMADNTKGQVYAIDTFLGTVSEEDTMAVMRSKEGGWLRRAFNKNMEGLTNVRVLQESSVDAAFLLNDKKFDMIFIDADHVYEAVRADILAWRPLLADGGLLCGHDVHMPGVRKAVEELIPNWKNPQGVMWTA